MGRTHVAAALRALLLLTLACAGPAEAPDAAREAAGDASATTTAAGVQVGNASDAKPATGAPGGAPATDSEQRRRFEEFARRSAGGESGDMEATFESQAEREMRERRAEALERGLASKANAPDLDTALLTDDILSELARDQKLRDGRDPVVGRPEMRCFPEDPGPEPDWVFEERLQRDDFRKKKREAPRPVVSLPGEGLDAWLQVGIACVLALEIQGDDTTAPTIEASGVQWQAYARRSRSWWNGASQREESAVLEHQQLHLTLAELFAADLARRLPELRERTRTSGTSLDRAAVRFRRAWLEELDAIALELQQLSASYDRQTRHGHDAAAQQLWAERIRGGLGDVRRLDPL